MVTTAEVHLGHRGTVDVIPGVVNDDALYAFKNGQCHALAIALAEKLDKPIFVFAVYEYSSKDEWWEDGGSKYDEPSTEWLAKHWRHAVVQLDWDDYLDITGVSSEDELAAEWAFDDYEDYYNYQLFAVSPEQLREFHTYTGGVAPDVETARSFVDPLLEFVEDYPLS